MKRFRMMGIYLLGVVMSFAIAIWVLSFRKTVEAEPADAADEPPMPVATQP